MEQTFFIIKPDGVKRGLVGEVLKRIEQRGFTIENGTVLGTKQP